MADWPSIAAPSFDFEEEVYLPQVRQEFEANYVASRPRATREIRRWTLRWSRMTEADFQTLEAFFIANQGLTFGWTHPVTSGSYTCRFSGNGLVSRLTRPGIRGVECAIEEA